MWPLTVVRQLRDQRLISALLLVVLCLVTAFLPLASLYTTAIIAPSAGSSIPDVQPPVLLLMVLILFLLVNSVYLIASIALEYQREHAAHGTPVRYHAMLHMGGGVLLIGVALVVGPLIALVLLHVFNAMGPHAGALAVQAAGLSGSMWALSLVAALLSLAAYALPALGLMRTGKNVIQSLPPLWMRYGFDLLMLIVGGGILVYLYSSGAAAFTDVLTLVTLALFLVGLGLLWVRLYPLMIRVLSWFAGKTGALTIQMAFWNVERDPRIYAHFVLILMGVLAIGAASMIIHSTHDASARISAFNRVGADASLTLYPQTSMDIDWTSISGVSDARPLMVLETDTGVTLVGVDEEAFPLVFSAFNPMAGIPLPNTAIRMGIYVYAEPDEDGETFTTAISAEVLNADGVRVRVPLQTDGDPTLTETWQKYSAPLNPEILGRSPWTLAGLRFFTRRESSSSFNHAVYLDQLTITNANGLETALDRFESGSARDWSAPNRTSTIRGAVLLIEPESEIVQSGAASMRVLYNVVAGSDEAPALQIRPTLISLEALVSPAFSRTFGELSARERPLEEGDVIVSALGNLLNPDEQIDLNLQYTVVGLIDSFAWLTPDQPFLIIPMRNLQAVLNADRSRRDFLGVNRVLVTLENPTPSADVIQALSTYDRVESVTYAWDEYLIDRRAPLPGALSGILYVGFCLTLTLIVIGCGFYLATLTRRREPSFGVLMAMGWDRIHLWRMLATEVILLILPALVVGVVLGTTGAVLALPVLRLAAGDLIVPVPALIGLAALMGAGFVVVVIVVGRLQGRTHHSMQTVVENGQ